MNLIANVLFAALTLAAQAAPDASMMQPVQRWIAAYNAGAAPLPEDIFADDAVVTDEFPPFVWVGKTGEHAWASAIDAFIRPGRQHVSVGAAQSFQSTRDGTRVSFVLPATLTFTSSRTGGRITEHALWQFVLERSAAEWKIAADTWTRDAGAGAVSMHLRQENGVLLVDARVNGAGPMLFTLDPGESDLYTAYTRKQLHGSVPQTVCLSDACFSANMEYLDGDPNQIDPKHDPSLGIIAGSIGPQLLRRYVVQIDYRSSTLTLIPPAQFHAPPDAPPLALRFDSNGVPAVQGAVDGIGGELELDVRAPRSMLFTPFLDRTGMRRKYSGKSPAVRSVQIGSVDLHDVPMRFSTDSTGKFASSDVAGLLGNNILSRCVVTFDLPHRSAYLRLS
jgi:ketosteroid isomerase-like protein